MSELIRVPDIGNGEGEVIELLVKPGDKVEADQSLLTLESDNASMEIPSPASGVVESVSIKVGDEVGTGDLILKLKVEGAAPAAEEQPAAAP
ncbi:biotin/lipoyl-containing protein, partial [Morganella morganii]